MGRIAKVGGTRVCKTFGYIFERIEDHPGFPGKKWVLQHHLVWWKYRKQRVPRGFVLHHKDEDRTHNKMRNLELITRAEHARLHGVGRKWTFEQREHASFMAKRRCTFEWREAVSLRERLRHAKKREEERSAI